MQELSFGGKRWHVPEDVCSDIPTLVERRLRALQDVETWFDPSVLPESSKAAERVQKAIKDTEKIAIFGDYDCDGITGVSQIVRYFRRHNTEPLIRLPHRVHDGY